ncbi:MAG: sulfatase [Planctomycetaceae bacterium]|nr:sulfatase [Planctomycetaceae bacterium]
MASALWLLGSYSCHAADRKPNVVLFLVDDMGWMDSEPYGSQYYETPNMTRLAAQSMRFTDAYALPLCSPTRASILSGQYSARHGVTSASGHRPPAPEGASLYPESVPANRPLIYADSQNYLAPEVVTLAETLRDAGYRTGHFGKWHLGLMPQHWPEQQGFETTWHCAPDPGPPSYFSPYGVKAEGRPTGQAKVGNVTDGPDGEYITDRLTDEAIAFIDAHRDEPFYLNLWQYGVHGPWGHKEAYTAEFAKKTDPRGEQRNPIMASMLKSVDESLGRVLDRLDQHGLADNTLFIFYSDNGGNVHSNVPGTSKTDRAENSKSDMLRDWRRWAGDEPPTNNAPLREGKGRIYEGGQRVPLMVRWPGHVVPQTTTNAIVGPIDLYPTILDALKVASPSGHVIDGESFLPVLTQSGSMQRDAYFTWFPHIVPAVSVRAGDWKLIHRFEPHRDYPEVRELYNLRDDIGETTNLAQEHSDRVEQLDAMIAHFITETGALAPKPNPAYRPSTGPAPRGGDPAAGLVPKFCQVTMTDGALRVEADGRNPFLGTAQVKHSGPLTLVLSARSRVGGEGKVQWKTVDQENFPNEGQQVSFQLPAGDDWQAVRVDLPIEGRTQLVRLYLPVQESPVDVRSITYADPKTSQVVRQWEFGAPK